MTDPVSKDAIFIKWGRFQAGAHGRWAVTAFLLAFIGALVGRALGLW